MKKSLRLGVAAAIGRQAHEISPAPVFLASHDTAMVKGET
jgi:hypothetical protein